MTEENESLESRKLRLEVEDMESARAHTQAANKLALEKARVDLEKATLEKAALEVSLAQARDEENERFARLRHLTYHFTESVSAASVNECRTQLDTWSALFPGEPLEVVFTSPGGSVYHGMALFDHLSILRRKGHFLTTGAEGMAASMAGILLQAGDKRWAGEESWSLIHEISTGDWGKTSDLEDTVEHLKRMQDRVISIFLRRAAAVNPRRLLTREEFVTRWKKIDWWLTGQEMFIHGFVDEVRS